ncbi:helix-turn-helix transcriptional regulator [Holophaga foetida]|uniref:helix-turn-helix transcriptional regulator n=1 Tax=Holophaga foetida TaxID=35839 RepID=UPI001FCC5F59|nr:AraC family transcriptional regulator [Holophaga foetida]
MHLLSPLEARCKQIFQAPNRAEGMVELKAMLDAYATTHHGNFPGIPTRVKVVPGFVTLSDEADIAVVRQLRYLTEFRHSHGFIELLYVYAGQCHLQSSLGGTLLNEGDLCIVSPDTLHTHGVDDDSAILLYAMFRQDSFDGVFQSLLSESSIASDFLVEAIYGAEADQNILFHTGSDAAVKKTFLRLYYECEQALPLRDPMMANLLNHLILTLVRDHDKDVEIVQAGRSQESNALSPVISHIHAHYRTITLQELASRFNYSPSRLSDLFKRHVGKTFNTFIRELRIHKAARLLKSTRIRISDIAEHLGYADTSHLNKEFRHFFRTTPAAYRQSEGTW